MTSSDDPAGDVPTATPTDRTSTTSLASELLGRTWPLLLAGLMAVGLVAAVVLLDGLARELSIAALVSAFIGPYALTYLYLVVWFVRRRQEIPVLLVDEDHRQVSAKGFHPDDFAKAEVDEDLAQRDGTAGTVYVADDMEIEQRETVDRESGEKTVVARRVLKGNWEGGMHDLEAIEESRRYISYKQKFVPLVRNAVEVRAEADAEVIASRDDAMHSALLGAEEDTMFDTQSIDWGIDLERDDLEDLMGEDETERAGEADETTDSELKELLGVDADQEASADD